MSGSTGYKNTGKLVIGGTQKREEFKKICRKVISQEEMKNVGSCF